MVGNMCILVQQEREVSLCMAEWNRSVVELML